MDKKSKVKKRKGVKWWVRDWEMERKGSKEEHEETLPASWNGLPSGWPRGQPAAMAGDALQSPSPSEWNWVMQVVALRVHVTAHSETTSSKSRFRDLSLKETLWYREKRGLSESRGASSFCQRMPLPSQTAASTPAAQSLPVSLPLHSHFYTNLFSWVNLVQLIFCCLTSILGFEAIIVSAFMHQQSA